MNNHKHQNSDCAYAERLAAYLYEEIGDAEKPDFENHLADCHSCAAELSDFSVLRSSISDWRVQDFEPLATPVTVLPVPETARKNVSWFEHLKLLFAFSPAKAAAFAVLIALALFAGQFWFSGAPQSVDLAKAENTGRERTKNAASDAPQPDPTARTPAAAQSLPPTDEPSRGAKDSSAPLKNPNVKNNIAPGKTTAQPALVRNQVGIPAAANPAPKVKTPVKNSAPALDADDDDDDNSLRLSDMFEEVGMNETGDIKENSNNE